MVVPTDPPKLLSLNLDDLPQLDVVVASPSTSTFADSPSPDPRQHRSQTTRQNVMNRLHALLPSSTSTPVPPAHSPHTSADLTLARPPKPPPEPRKFLKIRVITWNMHDSLPKGNLDELLGVVQDGPEVTTESIGPHELPTLLADASHPYHIIVVAGQECPSVSGIPMGLGAGFRRREKEKEKEKQKEKDKDEPILKRRSLDDDRDSHDSPPSGWTYILEEWFCHGNAPQGTPPALSKSTLNPATSDALVTPPAPVRSHSTDDVAWRARERRGLGEERRKGPYEMLIKERLMGIYLAVFIKREVKPLVRGTSKSTVTSGLIGGRLGNKGGVGISLDIAGTTLLFINAHLAAHENKIPSRLANFAKIKAELSLDDFLANDDERVMKEDITDRFDYTFLFGDLNFRLDLTRLHADWLISRQEYEQALAFDQLVNIMKNGLAFVGFKEAPIRFAPTFKYDVLRTLKKHKRTGSHGKHRALELSEVEERDDAPDEPNSDDDDDDAGGEGASLASSAWTGKSRRARERDDDDDEDYFHAQTAPGRVQLAHRISLSGAAHKAKTKWAALLTPGARALGRHSPNPNSTSTLGLAGDGGPKTAPVSPVLGFTPPSAALLPPDMRASKSTPASVPRDILSKSPSIKRALSTRSGKETQFNDDDHNRGIYDSSSKQRVPSWCDRILWKSTVEPEPEEDEPPLAPTSLGSAFRPRARVNNFLNQVLRPLSLRSRAQSNSSMSTVQTRSEEDGGGTPETPGDGVRAELDRQFDAEARRQRALSIDGVVGAPPPPLVFPLDAVTPGARKPSLARSASHADLPPRPRAASTGVPFVHSNTLSATPTHHAQASFNLPRFKFFGFLSPASREPSQSTLVAEEPEPPPVALPRKGDVVCLSYDTLDDRGMRRLEGRSDHRPVVGSYAVYL